MIDTDIYSTYAFGAAMFGSKVEQNEQPVTVEALGVVTVAYERIDGSVYALVLKDGEGNTLGELGSNALYYLYYPMPQIQYVKEIGNTLTPVTGCLWNDETGQIEPDDSVTYSHAPLMMNGKTVEQGQSLEIPLNGLTISQSGNNFRMPPILDDGTYERYLIYTKLGVGTADSIDYCPEDGALTMQLRMQDNTLKYSFDGSTWKNLSMLGSPTIYAVYTERGYDLQLSKTVDTSESGVNPLISTKRTATSRFSPPSLSTKSPDFASRVLDGATISSRKAATITIPSRRGLVPSSAGSPAISLWRTTIPSA